MREIFGELPDNVPWWHPAVLIATWFGTGLLPIGPGTWASAAAILCGVVVLWLADPWVLAVLVVVVTLLGLWACPIVMAGLGAEDPPEIVIDEVAGQWIVLIAAPFSLEGVLVAFALFRFFDTLKVWPANIIDQNMAGALGVMLDDLVAGVYAAVVVLLLRHFGFI